MATEIKLVILAVLWFSCSMAAEILSRNLDERTRRYIRIIILFMAAMMLGALALRLSPG